MIRLEPTTKTATFWVRDIPIYGDTILSPMAQYSDVPYRALCRAYGSGMNCTEFVPAGAFVRERNPMWRRLDIHPAGEKPMVFQLFSHDAQLMLNAAQKVAEWEPDIIDVNMGCSAPRISYQGAGVGMMRQPKLIAETFRLLTKHLTVPITGKIRLGWDESSKNFLEIGRILEDNGAALIAIHGRTKMQNYRGEADWDAIAELKQAISIPVIGNGDVKTAADIDRMKAYTGCDGVMIGRAAIGNPWIFARRERDDVMFGDVTAVIRLHLQEMNSYYGNPAGLHAFHRHLKRYLMGLAVKPTLRRLLAAESYDKFEEILLELETAVPLDQPISILKKIRYFPL